MFDLDYMIRLVPPNCVGYKCVFKTRIVSSRFYAFYLLSLNPPKNLRLKGSARILWELGKKLSSTSDNVRETIIATLKDKTEDLNSAVDLLTKVANDPLTTIETMHRRGVTVKTGWKVVSSPVVRDVFLIPKDHIIFNIEYLTFLYKNFLPAIVFCSTDECYPLALGLFPTKNFTGLAYESGKPELVDNLVLRYGFSNIQSALTNLMPEIKGAGIAIHVKKSGRNVATFFIYVDNAREVTQKLSMLQRDALEAKLKLFSEVVGEEASEAFALDAEIKSRVLDILSEDD